MATASTAPLFSRYHPMIPKCYVPPWQLDMNNRRFIIENCNFSGLENWKGHVTMFLDSRERLGETVVVKQKRIPRRLWHFRASALSKYNSSLMARRSATD
ncbi:uncharacterized protein LOC134185827 isoform X2 [Corticium candelabrum]|uniref:uncharacterized protein LOC134185827 isoform X2 n=1 Tax=Corticium candelabrum TaxID=121492 RepID=UPI002E26E8DE|nr:uncharacterized protein LOC134185827 isoform X2 [Corticium candelabrum]